MAVDDLRETAPDPVAELRDAVLGDYRDYTLVAKAANMHPRSLRKFMDQGLPYIKVGRSLLVQPRSARAWLIENGTPNRAPRRVGRPRKAA